MMLSKYSELKQRKSFTEVVGNSNVINASGMAQKQYTIAVVATVAIPCHLSRPPLRAATFLAPNKFTTIRLVVIVTIKAGKMIKSVLIAISQLLVCMEGVPKFMLQKVKRNIGSSSFMRKRIALIREARIQIQKQVIRVFLRVNLLFR